MPLDSIHRQMTAPLLLLLAVSFACESSSDRLGSGNTQDAAAADAPPAPDATAVTDAAADASTVENDSGLADASTTCTPSCWLRECGDDGCGGSCGTCLEGATCTFESGVCDCPASTCEGRTCGVSSCGRVCGLCDGFQACVNNTCQDSVMCTARCRDRNFATSATGQFVCEGEVGLGTCASDPTRGARCTCEGMDPLVCDDCFLSDPVGCRPGTCTDAERCNLWTGRCEPAGQPTPVAADIGEPCGADLECASSGGIGAGRIDVCRTTWPGGYCMSYCNPPPDGFWGSDRLEQSNCPPGALCLPGGFAEHPTGYGACLAECTDDADCRNEDYFCRKTFGSTTTVNGVCTFTHCRSRGCPGSFECGC